MLLPTLSLSQIEMVGPRHQRGGPGGRRRRMSWVAGECSRDANAADCRLQEALGLGVSSCMKCDDDFAAAYWYREIASRREEKRICL